MSPSSQRISHRALQSLLMKRFGMAVATYALILVLCWVALLGGLFRVSTSTALIGTGLVALSQLVFFWIFLSGHNLRFADPSLTQAQVLIAMLWHTWLLSMVDTARGTLLAAYVLILLFGVFQLKPRVFVRCAALGFFAFAGLNLYEAYRLRLPDPALALLQVCVLFVLMTWMSLFASYVQALRQRMRQRRFALQAHQDTLRGMMRQLEDMVATDELTGLFNRRHFLRLAGRELDSLEGTRQLGLALIDLDHFKRINDVHGHASGDRVLQTFAAVARACLRDGDVLARYGGEEFVLLIPNCDADRLTACCERLRAAYAAAEPVGVQVERLSLSAGMTLLSVGDDLDDALQRADQALYRAKRGGRNRCDAAWEEQGA
ncbi:GGDEF domain-containing protein [Metapseudomonas furukawaii]|jgi:diguanylate cyclase (GGDEF)-like protein|uniref:diguanylate cyclase n=1 Tax=Metapseudomonas furukawaii TaxID=1149133 RepID=L8ME38_METFU|nr:MULTISPECIES: GGDEF domain-containing protein [Pseudomonas]ELS26222.1 GGDEF domain containing protein [Pseudomonas furukawaii]ELS28300.1 GGDEF domain containing protein [Pseudomonas furukawaii]OWJ96715.1 GGDEF domain-containing protein [Pseudomonas sp. A46]BAU76331.1 GGDEF domain protein [Pseudomonas furukawaii]